MPKAMFTRPADAADIEFHLNGKKHKVSDKFPPTTTLNDYIREVAGLPGTKVMCKEAGCGCCAVTVTHALEGQAAETMSINSCVCPLYSVDGWQITTTEGLGSHKTGLHPIQQRLVEHSGTQCGYCSPGFVMSMYGLLHQQPKPSMAEIEASLDGHICRCTGYRSILDAMKTFAVDSPAGACIDIEDLNKNLCPKTGEPCPPNTNPSSCGAHRQRVDEPTNGSAPSALDLDLRESHWYRPLTLKDLGKILQKHKKESVKMLFGNTASGIFKYEGPYEVYIDLRTVKELHLFKESKTSVVFGAGTTLGKFRKRLLELGDRPGFHYFPGMVRHLNVLASVLVRNAGSMAGNLMIKYAHPWFPSDLFTMLEAVGANVEIFDSKTSRTSKHSLIDFLRKVDMKFKVITAVELPSWASHDHYRSFKITPRWQNAHAYVNAAFKIPAQGRKIVGRPRIVVGGISAEMVHALNTEAFLESKTLDDQVVNAALKTMFEEVKPDVLEVGGSVEYRRQLAVNLLYKTLLGVYKPMKPSLQSGALSMERPLSSGLQTYQQTSDKLPIGQGLPKKTAPLQVTGEAIYTNDMPMFKDELQAAFVTTSIAKGKIDKIDTTEALKIPGVVGFIGADDISPEGVNNYIPVHPFVPFQDEIFVSENIEYAGKPVGLILAETQALAEEGARAVKISYKNVERPVIDLRDAIAKKSFHEGASETKMKGGVDAGLKQAAYVVEGECEMGTQYHFYIENQIALCVPSEDGMDVYTATQAAEFVQRAASQALGKPMNYFNVVVNRLGGSFGGKFLPSTMVGASAAVAANVAGRPVRLNLDLSGSMKNVNKRWPLIAKYRAGCDRDGKLVAIDINLYIDSGHRPCLLIDLLPIIECAYYSPNYRITLQKAYTNKAHAGPVRAPGQVPGCLIMETVLEHLGRVAKQDPVMLREINLMEDGQQTVTGLELKNVTIKKIWQRLKQTAEVTSRQDEVSKFNQNNMWRKRGLAMTAVRYDMEWLPFGLACHLSIFAADGTVTIMTAGVEMGQGLYMKIAQAAAYRLNIPVDFIKIRSNQNNVTPNPFITGGSTGSERSVASVLMACDQINERLQPVREKMPDADWKTLVLSASFMAIDLSAEATHVNHADHVPYSTYMAGVVETELDVLTGEFQVKRVDMMADFGESMNPIVDIGQVEGAFVMGLGAYLTEDIFFNKETGQLLNDGTWEYKPPTTKDIPIDWRIHFLPDTPNRNGVLSSKAVGEPPIGLAMGALLAIKQGVAAAREGITGDQTFVPTNAPLTVEKAHMTASIPVSQLLVGSSGY
ncbi:hypothetical protein EGW08_001662 [Elysia chlorotica]|uniref:FAD-binding PCMH-type domain-containing protein n=1 Tax=Elysia chlorotica TaxID=188477 RepID=A0A433U9Q3_ELYCH|nr:hypothetical protein EGW08_001662 [Elysia chlorotica]